MMEKPRWTELKFLPAEQVESYLALLHPNFPTSLSGFSSKGSVHPDKCTGSGRCIDEFSEDESSYN